MDARSGAPNLFSGAATRTGHPPRWRLPVGGWMERVTGIEPAFSAWEADVLPLNYTRLRTLAFADGHGSGIGKPLATVRNLARCGNRRPRRLVQASRTRRCRSQHEGVDHEALRSPRAQCRARTARRLRHRVGGRR